MHTTNPAPVMIAIATTHVLASTSLFYGSLALWTFVNVQTLSGPAIHLILLILVTTQAFVSFLLATRTHKILARVALNIFVLHFLLFRVQNGLAICDRAEK
jgi:hypothetical protein